MVFVVWCGDQMGGYVVVEFSVVIGMCRNDSLVHAHGWKKNSVHHKCSDTPRLVVDH